MCNSYRRSQYYTTLRLRYSFTLCVVGIERSMSEAARRTSRGRKSGALCICDAPKARPAGPSPHLGCAFVQRRRKTQMARPEGPSRCCGYCSFVEERRSESLCLCNALAEEAIKRSAEARGAEALRKIEARRAEPTWHSVHAEARTAEGRGPRGRDEILRVVNLLGNGSEPDCATLQRRGPQGRAHIWGCAFVQRRRKTQMAWREGPSRFGLSVSCPVTFPDNASTNQCAVSHVWTGQFV